MPYIPLHDRPPYYASVPASASPYEPTLPRYASPDLDPSIPLCPIMSDSEHLQGEAVQDASRKRRRQDDDHPSQDGHNGHQEHHNAVASSSRPGFAPRKRVEIPIIPSIFGISPRNEFTRTVGEFILFNARDHQNVEIEIKLGTIMSPLTPQDPTPRRMRLPTMSEMIMPVDYPIGNFLANMTKAQNIQINGLLNGAVESSIHSPFPMQFYRAQHVDSFYNTSSTLRGGGKIRVSRDRAGNVIEGGSIKKKRIADLNIFCPKAPFDLRVSVSTEEPTDVPDFEPSATRDKDRACYKHQLCQVDLTVVTAKSSENAVPSKSYELEIEILDVPGLLAEGEKEPGGSDKFYDMLQSVLDTARMIIRNAPPAA